MASMFLRVTYQNNGYTYFDKRAKIGDGSNEQIVIGYFNPYIAAHIPGEGDPVREEGPRETRPPVVWTPLTRGGCTPGYASA